MKQIRSYRCITTIVLLGSLNLPLASPQSEEEYEGNEGDGFFRDLQESSSLCRAPKASVGSNREYIVGANSWHIPVLDYLTDLIGPEFDPPISFTRVVSNLYMQESIEDSLAMGLDFMVANSHVSSCVESEGNTVSLATQIPVNYDPNTGESFNISLYGSALFVLDNRTDIQTLEDIKGKKIGTNKYTNLATHLCYDVLLRHGIHHLQDPEQTIFFLSSEEAIDAVLAGQVDVGCAATTKLESRLDLNTGEHLDMSQIRILNPQQHWSDGKPFPFVISSDIVPNYLFAAYPHVEQSVKIRLQEELLAMRDHADVAPSLLACLDSNGCSVNNTACLDECFQALPAGTIRSCRTTADIALKAFDALNASELVGFIEPLGNLRLRDIQETTGVLLKDPSPRCVRMENIVDATTCPSGHFARSSEEIIQQCNASGIPCFDRECICNPCVEAFEVDVFTVRGDEGEEDDYETIRGVVGSGCSKFSLCGSVQQEHSLRFVAVDNKGRPNATMTGSFLLDDESEEHFSFEETNGTFHYDFLAAGMLTGQKVVKVRINNKEIPESPLRIAVLNRDCAADTGDELREPDDWGECWCKKGMVEVADKCVSRAILIPSILVPSLLLFFIAVQFYVKCKKDQADNIWKVDPDDLHFDDPPRVLGRGTSGLVLSAEYRGTPVAVKRILSRKYTPKHSEMSSKQSHESVSKQSHESASVEAMESANNDSSKENGRATIMSTDGMFVERVVGFLSKRALRERKTARMRENFVVEIRLLSRLRHPCITTVMGAVISSKVEPMMVMEFMHFGSLHDLLQNESIFLEGKVLVGILHDIASGLRFLHSSDPQVLHGDLKSRNILVDDKFRAKVADFGCGNFSMSRTGSICRGEVRGTPFWMAPELLRAETTNTTASDVYAFGIVMYEVFSRREPYDDEPYTEVLRQVSLSNKRPPVPNNCPREAAKMMKACLKENPSERPTAMGLDICLRWMDEANFKTSCITSLQKKKKEAEHFDVLMEHMFPHHIAEALREGRNVEPETHGEVSIVVSNIVGYADFVSAMSTTKLSDLLDRLHSALDALSERLDLFKVETIGDAHMVVTNIDKPQPSHGTLAASFSVEAMKVASEVPIDVDDPSAGFVQLRVGFHTGPVVSHVIGTQSPRFTLIGDTVNTAAHMESSSKPGKIQCTEDSYRLILKEGDDTVNFTMTKRGFIKVKGVGDLRTYWIEPIPEKHVSFRI